ncbi:hypothetical protein D3C76_1698590 [compost metagenome]
MKKTSNKAIITPKKRPSFAPSLMARLRKRRGSSRTINPCPTFSFPPIKATTVKGSELDLFFINAIVSSRDHLAGRSVCLGS